MYTFQSRQTIGNLGEALVTHYLAQAGNGDCSSSNSLARLPSHLVSQISCRRVFFAI